MKYLSLLLLIIVIGATVGLFYLLAPVTNTPLFYFNLGYLCFLELLFFGAIIKVSEKRLFNVPNLAVVAQINRYVGWAALLMVVFNVGIRLLEGQFDLTRWYFGALILLTTLYSVIVIMVLQGGNYQRSIDNDISELSEQKNSIKSVAETISVDFKRIIKTKSQLDLEDQQEGTIVISNSLATVSVIPLGKFRRGGNAIDILRQELTNFQAMLTKFETIEGKDENTSYLGLMCESANKIKSQANIIKKL